jgi:hypothetical protein
MNIFVLDTDIKLAAQYHCDKHLVKMITEHNQILGSIAHVGRGIKKKSEITSDYSRLNFQNFPRVDENGDPYPYGIGYKNHPCTQWASENKTNYEWLCDLTIEMCKDYEKRYNKKHVGEAIASWYKTNPPSIIDGEITPFVLAMPEPLKTEDAVHSYRLYYASHKAYFAKWKNGEPSWWSKYLKIAIDQNFIHERSLPNAKKFLEEINKIKSLELGEGGRDGRKDDVSQERIPESPTS